MWVTLSYEGNKRLPDGSPDKFKSFKLAAVTADGTSCFTVMADIITPCRMPDTDNSCPRFPNRQLCHSYSMPPEQLTVMLNQ